MKEIESYIIKINNKIQLKQKELGFEDDNRRKENLRKDLNVLQLKKQIALIQKKIKLIERLKKSL